MEDIEKEGLVGQMDSQKEDETLVYTVESKMGADELRVRDTIRELVEQKLNREEIDKDSQQEMAMIEQELALQIRTKLSEKFGGCWGAIVGNSFSIGIGLKENDNFANFKIGIMNIVVFQYNSYGTL